MGACGACAGITALPASFLMWPTQPYHQPASAKGFQESHSAHCSQLIRASRTAVCCHKPLRRVSVILPLNSVVIAIYNGFIRGLIELVLLAVLIANTPAISGR